MDPYIQQFQAGFTGAANEIVGTVLSFGAVAVVFLLIGLLIWAADKKLKNLMKNGGQD